MDKIKLYFNEERHAYTDSFDNSYTSCTTLLHKLEPEFDKAKWSKFKAKEAGVSTKQILNQWDTITEVSCDRGNATHNKLENGIKDNSKFKNAIKYLTTKDDSDEMFTVADIITNPTIGQLDLDLFYQQVGKLYPEMFRVIKHYVDKGYRIYAETGVFLFNYLVSGMIDVLCIRFDEDNNPIDFVILDWKTNKDGLRFESGYYKKDKTITPHQLTSNFIRKDDRLKPPVSFLPQCNGSIYSLQLSMYALMVEMTLNIPCVGLGLCHIGTQFILNSYGMPLRSKEGLYTVDKDKDDIVKWFKIKYYKNACTQILIEHKESININKQTKLF